MAKTKTRSFDAAEYLDTPELAAEFLNEALEMNDPDYITKVVTILNKKKATKGVKP